jgi:hypothetical protein
MGALRRSLFGLKMRARKPIEYRCWRSWVSGIFSWNKTSLSGLGDDDELWDPANFMRLYDSHHASANIYDGFETALEIWLVEAKDIVIVGSSWKDDIFPALERGVGLAVWIHEEEVGKKVHASGPWNVVRLCSSVKELWNAFKDMDLGTPRRVKR